VSTLPLSPLTAVGGVSLALILACGPLGGNDLLKGGSKRIEGRGATEAPTGASHASPSRNQSTHTEVDLQTNVSCDARIDTTRDAACAITRIACGDTIQASNEHLKNHFGDDFYRAKFCTPRASEYGDSPETIYALTLPANMQADITLSSPCTDLDLFSIRWGRSDRCPSVSTSTGECEGSTDGATDSVRIVSVGKDENHLVWVDGKNGNTGNFELRVDCRAAR
jgi:hypothetical protein